MIEENQIWSIAKGFRKLEYIVLGTHENAVVYQEVHKTAEEGKLLPVLHAQTEHFLARHLLGVRPFKARLLELFRSFLSYFRKQS